MGKRYPTADESRQVVPRFANVIPRNGAWSGDNQIGREAPYGPDERQTQTVLKLDEWGPPDVWTISLFLTESLVSFNGFSVKARIGFGVGGSTQIYLCDWANGAQISLPMNAVNVEAIFEDVDVTTEGAGLKLGVQLARGRRGGSIPPRLTILENTTIANGTDSGLIDLPKFTKNICAVPTAGGSAAFYATTARMNVRTGNGAGSSTIAAVDGTHAPDGVIRCPVPVGGRRFRFDNAGAANITATFYAELDG